MPDNCLTVQKQVKGADISYSKDPVPNSFLEFFEENGQRFLLAFSYSYGFPLGGFYYNLLLYNIQNNCTYEIVETCSYEGSCYYEPNENCISLVASFNPENYLNMVYEEIVNHYCTSELNLLEKRFLFTSSEHRQNIHKTNDGIFFVERAELGGINPSFGYYVYIASVYFIYKVNSDGISLEGIFHDYSFADEGSNCFSDVILSGFEHLENNVFLAVYNSSEYLGEGIYKMKHEYQVFSTNNVNNNPSVNLLKRERKEEIFDFNDREFVLNTFGIDIDEYGIDEEGLRNIYFSDINYSNLYPIDNSRKVWECIWFYLRIYEQPTYFSGNFSFLRYLSFDNQYNIGYSNFVPLAKESISSFLSPSLISSLSNNSVFVDEKLYKNNFGNSVFFSYEEGNKIVIIGYPKMSLVFDLQDIGKNNVLMSNSIDLFYYNDLPSIFIYEKNNLRLLKSYISGFFSIFMYNLGLSGDKYEFLYSELPLFNSKRDVYSPRTPLSLTIKQEYNSDICQILSSKHSDIDYEECLTNNFYKSIAIYHKISSKPIFVPIYNNCTIGFVVNSIYTKNPGLYGNDKNPNLVDEFYIMTLFYVDLNDPNLDIKTKILDAGKLYVDDNTDNYSNDRIVMRRFSIWEFPLISLPYENKLEKFLFYQYINLFSG